MIPVLTVGVGMAHAIAGAIAGRRLIDRERTPTTARAAVTGAATSFIALLIFTPCFGAWIIASDARREDIASYVLLSLFTGVFTFLGAWWVLIPLSAAVALCLYKLHG